MEMLPDVIVSLVILLVSSLWHEFGHIVFGYFVGLKFNKIVVIYFLVSFKFRKVEKEFKVFNGFSVEANTNLFEMPSIQRIVCTSGGLIFTFLLSYLSLLIATGSNQKVIEILKDFYLQIVLTHSEDGRIIGNWIFSSNIMLCGILNSAFLIINALPVLPLDGGVILLDVYKSIFKERLLKVYELSETYGLYIITILCILIILL